MINNFQDLFIKYKNNLNSKNKILEIVIKYINLRLEMSLNKEDFKIDFKNKSIVLNKNSSSVKFILKTRLKEEDLEFLKKETGYNFLI